MKSIIGFRVNAKGIIEFQVEYVDGETAYHPFSVMKTDHPKDCADFIIDNKDNLKNDHLNRWARLFLCNLCRTI